MASDSRRGTSRRKPISRSCVACEKDASRLRSLASLKDPNLVYSTSSTPANGGGPGIKKSPAQEREAIEKALAATAGRISGPSGAAVHLGMPASTLESKIRSLKINKFRFKQT